MRSVTVGGKWCGHRVLGSPDAIHLRLDVTIRRIGRHVRPVYQGLVFPIFGLEAEKGSRRLKASSVARDILRQEMPDASHSPDD